MDLTVENVVTQAHTQYGANVTDRFDMYIDLVTQHIARCNFPLELVIRRANHKLPYFFNMAVRATSVAAYLTGDTPVVFADGQVQHIKSVDDLVLLHPVQAKKRGDKNLIRLQSNIIETKRNWGLTKIFVPNAHRIVPPSSWRDLVVKMGSYPLVVDNLGRRITSGILSAKREVREQVQRGENTLETVLQEANRLYDLDIGGENYNFYMEFLQRMQDRQPGFDLNYRISPRVSINPFPYLNAMVNSVLLFAYMTGRREIFTANEGPKTIQSSNDLYLLSSGFCQSDTDNQLTALYRRVTNNSRRQGQITDSFSNWGALINKIAQDGVVLTHLGKLVKYKVDVLQRPRESPNPASTK